MNPQVETFARLVRARSEEHAEAVRALRHARAHGVLVGILRQELDSLVRVVYLTQQPPDERDRLLGQMERGEKWTRRTVNDKHEQVTDKMMVEAAAGLHGWARSIYKFGCAFVHLSNLHDYMTRDPLRLVSHEEREDVLSHLHHYHGSPLGPDVTFDDLIPFLPRVFDKVHQNLDAHLRELERGGSLG